MSILDTYVDKIFIINLDERADRWEAIEKELKRMGITNYERYSAIKPALNDTSSDKVLKDFPKEYHSHLVSPWKTKRGYIQAAVGCKYSHYNIIKIAKERGYKKICIFEDDIEFLFEKEKFDEIFEKVSKEVDDFHLLYFSGNHTRQPEKLRDKKYLYRVKGTLCAHAYIISYEIFNFIIDTMMLLGMELDNYYIGAIQVNNKSYTIKPPLVTQSPGYSNMVKRNVDWRKVIS